MTDKAEVAQAVFSAIDEMNLTLPAHKGLEKSAATPLFGHRSNLDSLGLVSLIVAVEQEIADEFGAEITLADDRAMSRSASPFRTIETLVEYIVERLEEPVDA